MFGRSVSFALFIALFLIAACSQAAEAPVESEPVVSLPDASVNDDEPVRVAVLAIRSAVSANEQYGPILDYLEEELDRPFEIVPVTQEEQFTFIEEGKVDFTFNNPLAAVQIQRLYGTKFLATLSRENSGPAFSSLIVVDSRSDIYTVEDLYGKRATCVDFQTAAAGCTFQILHLLQQEFDPYSDFAEFTETPSQDNIVLGVLNGTHDVGFVRTGQLEKMVREGKIFSMDELRIIDAQDDGFYYPHSTRLYPEWPFAATENTDPALAAAVQEALLAMPADHPAMVNARAVGFVADVDYTPIDQLIITLRLKSWDVDVRGAVSQ